MRKLDRLEEIGVGQHGMRVLLRADTTATFGVVFRGGGCGTASHGASPSAPRPRQSKCSTEVYQRLRK